MKTLVQIARILVGGLFIFSGLVKAIDPLGLSYKMQEFFEVWAADHYFPALMNGLHDHSYLFSVLMITLEVALGVALLLGWKKKWTMWLLLLLIIFFTFLTSYVLFSGKIRTCGCFGDCIPLTPIQTFSKDVILLILSLFLLFNIKYIEPVSKSFVPGLMVLIAIIGTTVLQLHVVKYLPTVDCLPFKKGNNILELRKMPADAIQDKFEYSFIYEKNGVKKEFKKDFPDSTWTYVDRKPILVQKGNGKVPKINDFSFTSLSGTDTTEAILSQPNEYYLLFAKDFSEGTDHWMPVFNEFMQHNNGKAPVYIVTADLNKATELFAGKNLPIFTCDGTALKTAARATPTLYLMKGPVVQNKWGWPDMSAAKP